MVSSLILLGLGYERDCKLSELWTSLFHRLLRIGRLEGVNAIFLEMARLFRGYHVSVPQHYSFSIRISNFPGI